MITTRILLTRTTYNPFPLTSKTLLFYTSALDWYYTRTFFYAFLWLAKKITGYFTLFHSQLLILLKFSYFGYVLVQSTPECFKKVGFSKGITSRILYND